MTALLPDPKQGVNKTIASGLAGAASIILVYVIDQFVKTPLPAEIVAAVQMLVTTLIVWYVPHGGDN